MAGDALAGVSFLETRLGSSRSGMRERSGTSGSHPPQYTHTHIPRGPSPAAQRVGKPGEPPGAAVSRRDRDTYSSGAPGRAGAAGAGCGSPSSRGGGGVGRCPGPGARRPRSSHSARPGSASSEPEPPQTFNVSEEASPRSEGRSRGLRRGCALASRPERGAAAGCGAESIPLLHRPRIPGTALG